MNTCVLNLIFSLSFFSMSLVMHAQSDLLAKYRWESRVVLLFAPNESNLEYKTQQKIIENDIIGYRDRDLVVLTFILGSKKGQQLRREFKIKNEVFTFILIGKDGYEKMTTNKVVVSKDLFGTIDSMPMRINEMRRKKG